MKIIYPKPEHRLSLLALYRSLNRLAGDIYLEYAELERIDEAIRDKEIRIALDRYQVPPGFRRPSPGIIVGAIATYEQRNYLYVGGLIVKSRKRNQGIGRKLIREAIKKAEKLGKTKVVVETAFEYDSRGFYEKCGFKLTKTYHDSWRLIYKV
jgi:GNAT superfamily N-acetyltransferase